MEKLAIQIENKDTQIRLSEKGAQIFTGCVYYYHCMRLDSVGTANALGMKPPAVRQTLWRLNKVAEHIAAEKSAP